MPMILPRRPDVRELGFNDRVQVEGRSFDVQTEVVERSALEIRSTVLEQGRVLYTTSGALGAEHADVARAEEVVREQHDAVLGMVRRGEVH